MKKLMLLLSLSAFHANCFSFEVSYFNESKGYEYKVVLEDLIASGKNYYGKDILYPFEKVYSTVLCVKDGRIFEIVAEIGKNDGNYKHWILYDSSLTVRNDGIGRNINEKIVRDGKNVSYEMKRVRTGIEVSHPNFPRKEWKSKNLSVRNDEIASSLKPVGSSFLTKENLQKINNVRLINYSETGERLEISGKDLVDLITTFLAKENLQVMNLSLDKKNQKVIYFELYDDIYPTKRNVYTFAVDKSLIPEEIMKKFPVIMNEN